MQVIYDESKEKRRVRTSATRAAVLDQQVRRADLICIQTQRYAVRGPSTQLNTRELDPHRSFKWRCIDNDDKGVVKRSARNPNDVSHTLFVVPEVRWFTPDARAARMLRFVTSSDRYRILTSVLTSPLVVAFIVRIGFRYRSPSFCSVRYRSPALALFLYR